MTFFDQIHGYIFESFYLGNTINQYFETVLIIIIGIVVAYLVGLIMSSILKRVTKKTESPIDDRLALIISNLIRFFIIIIAAWIALETLVIPESFTRYINSFFIILCTLYVTWIISKNFQFFIKEVLASKANQDKMLNQNSLHFMSKIGRLVIWLVAVVILITNLGYDLTSIVTGLGLGGLALALAAQETLSGLFGYFSIYTDKPFKIGDYVTFGDKSGTVKDVGIRTTRLKTAEGSSVVILNNKISNDVIENFSKRKTRRVGLTLKFKASNKASSISKFKKDVENLLLSDKLIKDNFYVFTDDLRESFMVIKIVYHVFKPADFRNFTEVKDRINTEIHKLIEKAEIQLASSLEGLAIPNSK